MPERNTYDVAVVGGGNAGLSAALAARQAGASVIVLEASPRDFRGGNSRHTRNLRCAHAAPTEVLTESYSEDEFLADLMRVTNNEADGPLARLLVDRSASCPPWMAQFGVRFQPSLSGTLHLSRTNAFFLGGGKALMNSYYAAAARAGICVVYDAEVVNLDIEAGTFRAASVRVEGRTEADHRRRSRHRGRRLRGQHRVASRDLGRGGRQLHHSRHAVQQGNAAEAAARCRRAARRRSRAVSCDRR